MREGEKGEREDITFRTHTQVNTLDNIHERLILLILHVRTSPTRSARCLTCDF